MTVVTRFAPSPTGYLHVGGARTALYSWLVAKAAGGKFVLRIEDTDRERSTQPAIDAILEGMEWLGLTWDDGPYYQTKRFDRYTHFIDKLLAEDKAYKCYCSTERLEKMREEQMERGEKPRYDGHCRDNPNVSGDRFVVRFRNPQTGSVKFNDHIRGPIEFANTELDDLIISRSDGTPTYNFCVVIDDWEMDITHVVRGEDHINNTPRQINILQALGAPVPEYAHVSMILGDDGKKLSKRHGAVSVMQYRDDGYLPQAVLNYLVRLGWSHGDQEIFSVDEMIEHFRLDDVNKAASAFNTEKLNWLNQHYMKALPVGEVAEHLQWHFSDQAIDVSNGPALEKIIPLLADRAKTLKEIATSARYFYEEFEAFDEAAAKKHLRPVAREALEAVKDRLASLDDWNAATIQATIQSTADDLGVGMGKVGMPLRVAATGSGNSPSLDVTLELLDQKQVIGRIARAISFIHEREQAQQ